MMKKPKQEREKVEGKTYEWMYNNNAVLPWKQTSFNQKKKRGRKVNLLVKPPVLVKLFVQTTPCLQWRRFLMGHCLFLISVDLQINYYLLSNDSTQF